MSYSFDFAAATKKEAKAKVAETLDEVVAGQPAHAKDRDAALAVAGTFIDMLVDDDTKDIRVSMYGSVGYVYDKPEEFTAASVSVSAWYIPKGSELHRP